MSDVGIIGQIYEDRRTHKKGKLLERDEKYKTLLMESDDGKSFNITYGGFKSNWRKVDEEVPTIEEAMQEVEVLAEPVKEVKKDKFENEKITFFGEYLQKVLKLSEKFTSDVVVSPAEKKLSVSLKVRNAKLFETFAKYKIGYYNTLVPTVLVEENSELTKLGNIRKLNAEGENRNRVCLMLKPECVDDFLDIMEKCIYKKLESDIEKKEDK